MAHLFFDIETIPVEEEKYPVLKDIYRDKLIQYKPGDKASPGTFDEFIASTSLSGAFGRIFCIAYALGDGPVEILHGDEGKQLETFWKIIDANKPLIGHNILQFDLPFIIQRSRVLGVKFKFIPPKPWEKGIVYDTLVEWKAGGWMSGWNSLDIVARALGLESSKMQMNGGEVAKYYKAGKEQEILDYCKADVELTREVYKKLTFN